MRKIIVAFDGLKYSASTRDYAIRLSKQNNAHLVGIFLDDITYQSYKIYELIPQEGGISLAKQEILDKNDARKRANAALNFIKCCKQHGVVFSVHHDRHIAIRELLHESIYADLLIINTAETLTHYNEKTPTRFIRDLLPNVQCPVLLVPRKFTPIHKIVLLYDGQPSSVHALKMFSYLLGNLKQHPIQVVIAKTGKQTLQIPDNRLMKEFMKQHFPRAMYTVLKGLPEEEIPAYLERENPGTLVVLGAYQRSMVSRWFRTSMADILMKSVQLPFFVAHH